MASKARDLSNFISVATIDASEIASNAITADKIADVAVTHAKLHTDMNLSGKTLTFATNQISGNSIDGGVISNFASTGIDDNSSATAVTILSDGKVGIGITSPIRQLHLASSVPSIRLEDTDVSGAYNDIVLLSTGELSIRVDHGNVQSNSSLSFLIDADEKMRIDSSGRVGIGTSSPNSALETVGGDGITISNSGDTFLQLKTTGSTATNYIEFKDSGGSSGNISYNHTNNYLATKVNGAERMRIDSSGNVGIATSSPTELLSVGNTSTQYTRMQFYAATNGASTIHFGDGTSGADNYRGYLNYAHDSNSMQFATNGAERMRITNDGRGTSDFTIRAWINFNGTGTIAIRDSHNVSSIVDGATGDYVVNFANNMPSTGYATGLGVGGAAVLISSGRDGMNFNTLQSYRIGVRGGNSQAWTDTELITAMWCGG